MRPFGTFRAIFAVVVLLPAVTMMVVGAHLALEPDSISDVCRSLTTPSRFVEVPLDVEQQSSELLGTSVGDLREPTLDDVSSVRRHRSLSAMADATDADAVCVVSAGSHESADDLTAGSYLLLVRQHPAPDDDCFGPSCTLEEDLTEICVHLFSASAGLVVPGDCWRSPDA